MLMRSCVGDELRLSVAERTKDLASRCHALRSSMRSEQRSPDRRKPRQRKSQSRWYVKQPPGRWSEEKVDGAIYTVYLKKVRYHRPTRNITSSESDDDRSHLEWETVRVRSVKAGTLERLVEALATDDGELESTYVNVFLATYRSFASCDQVLDLLLRRYESLAAEDVVLNSPEAAQQHRKTLVACLHVWLDTYSEDFRQPPSYPALHHLLSFTQIHLPGSELHSKVSQKLAVFSTEWPPLGGGLAALRLTPHPQSSYRLPHVPHRHFAEQLTRMDADLFKRLLPHQCMGSMWSNQKKRPQLAPTVLATISQFNAVSERVTSTLLGEIHLKPQDRADILAAWLDIARELRVLKNFSSLKAIINALQTEPLHRLKKMWELLPKDKYELFEELARIFSNNNMYSQRELLGREGTAKFADTYGENDRQLQKLFTERGSLGVSHGTIPYLGNFLHDLMMIDTANPDNIDGLINFNKKKKEFEILAQIKLFQGAANAYQLLTDPLFDRWFESVSVLKDPHFYSFQIEPDNHPGGRDRQASKSCDRNGHRKNDSIASTSSSNSSQFYCETDGGVSGSSKRESLERKASPTRLSHGSSNSSLPSLNGSVSSANSSQKQMNGNKPGGIIPGHANSHKDADYYIIRVTCETDSVETDGVVLYKSIMLSNKERTPQVIRNAMDKLNLEGRPDDYTLAQVLHDKEMVLYPDANVYYAVNTNYDLNFILRLRNSSKTIINGKTKGKRT